MDEAKMIADFLAPLFSQERALEARLAENPDYQSLMVLKGIIARAMGGPTAKQHSPERGVKSAPTTLHTSASVSAENPGPQDGGKLQVIRARLTELLGDGETWSKDAIVRTLQDESLLGSDFEKAKNALSKYLTALRKDGTMVAVEKGDWALAKKAARPTE